MKILGAALIIPDFFCACVFVSFCDVAVLGCFFFVCFYKSMRERGPNRTALCFHCEKVSQLADHHDTQRTAQVVWAGFRWVWVVSLAVVFSPWATACLHPEALKLGWSVCPAQSWDFSP